MSQSMELKVTSGKSHGFYMRAAATFLRGTETKDALSAISITGVGSAVNVAIAVATQVERTGLGRITRVATDYISQENRSACRIVIDVERACVDVRSLAPQLAEELAKCHGSLEHVMYVQSPDTSDATTIQDLDKLLGGHRHSRVGVIGSLNYDYPGILYKEHGGEAVRRVVESAAEMLISKARPSAVVNGGSYGGPQGSMGVECEKQSVPIVHVIPNIDGAVKDLKGIIWDGDSPRIRKNSWRLAFVGDSWSRRNCILAALNGQYVMCAGGPGTYTELCELRFNGAGLLPLVHTGGLCEGAAYGEHREKNAHGMREALASSPPLGVASEHWRVMLGEKDTPLEEYCEAVRQVFGSLKLHDVDSDVSNRWPMSTEERDSWEAAKNDAAFGKANS